MKSVNFLEEPTYGQLRLDPERDLRRRDPRFEKLLEEAEEKIGSAEEKQATRKI